MNVTLPVHVSIISDYGIALPASQESGLNKALHDIDSIHSGRVVLHHGCTTQADEIARRVARSVGWRVEGHPAGATAGIVPPQSAAVRAELIHPARPHDDRDMDLIWASDVIVAVESDWGETSALVHHAAAAGWEVTYIKSSKLGVIPAQGHPSTAGSWPTVHNWLGDAWR